ncbi:hypothetical protein WMF38_51775 [Sorangium sp. So ce118]
MYQHILEYWALGSAGALSLELMKAYELREKLTTSKFRRLLRSKLFWLVELGMIFTSGFVAWLINAAAQTATPWQVAVAGIAARGLLRSAGEASAARSRLVGGAEDPEEKLSLKEIFR